MSEVTSAHLRKWLYDITWHKPSISISLKAAKRRRGSSRGQLCSTRAVVLFGSSQEQNSAEETSGVVSAGAADSQRASSCFCWSHSSNQAEQPVSQQLIGVHSNYHSATGATAENLAYSSAFWSDDGSVTAEHLIQPGAAGAQHARQRPRFGKDFH